MVCETWWQLLLIALAGFVIGNSLLAVVALVMSWLTKPKIRA
jgi:hypothetical protein